MLLRKIMILICAYCMVEGVSCISLASHEYGQNAQNVHKSEEQQTNGRMEAAQLPKPQQHNINHLTEMNALRKQQHQPHSRYGHLQQQRAQLHSHTLQQQQLQQHEHLKSYDKNNDVVVDIISGHDVSPSNATATATTTTTTTTSTRKLSKTRAKRQLSDLFIVPNTNWCGRGNTANGTYNHLGGASLADKCCRRHDNCQLYIPSLSNRYDLFNYRPYTLSHCSCDRRFYTCLKLANDEAATTVGKLFFNMLKTQCFVLRNERVCQQRDADGNCLQDHVKQKAYIMKSKKF